MGPSTIALLKAYLPGFEPEVVTGPHGWETVYLPRASGADYAFSVHEEPGGERQIGADRTGGRPGEYFWWYPFEMAQFRGDAEELAEAYLDALKRLICHETQIVQKKGLVWWSLACEYLEDGKWKKLSGHLGLRLFISAPTMTGRVAIYRSMPLAKGMHA